MVLEVNDWRSGDMDKWGRRGLLVRPTGETYVGLCQMKVVVPPPSFEVHGTAADTLVIDEDQLRFVMRRGKSYNTGAVGSERWW